MTDLRSSWAVLSVEQADELVITAKYLVQPKFCLKCGSESFYKHGPKPITYRDAPIGSISVVIHAVLTRYRCRYCKSTFIQPVTGIEPYTRMTRRCVDYIQNYCLHDTFTQIAHHLGCDEKTVRTVSRDYIARLNKAYKPDLNGWIGIGETIIDGKQVVLLVNIKQCRYIDMLETSEKTAVSTWLLHHRNAPIEGFVLSMWDPYQEAIRTVLPNIPIVVDHLEFAHLADQAMNKGSKVINNKGRGYSFEMLRAKLLFKDNHVEILKSSGESYPGKFASLISDEEILKKLDSNPSSKTARTKIIN